MNIKVLVFSIVTGILVIHAHEGHEVPDDNGGRNANKGYHVCTDCSDKVFVHIILCNEFNVTAMWSKSAFVGDQYDVKLLDNTCNNFRENKTSVWITTGFGTCGSTIIEHRNVIIQKNSAFFTVRNVTGNIVREQVYKYNLQCVFQRKNNASTGYKVIQGIKTINLASESAFDITVDIYTSSSFLLKHVHPITVSTDQPIYIGIKKTKDNKHFKMIVEQCFATPTSNAADAPYVFFHDKCPQDSSVNVIEYKDNKFNFVIKAFKFVRISKAVYIHCRIFICRRISKSPQCNQACGQRRQRRVTRATEKYLPNNIFENIEVQEIQNVTTERIIFVKKKSCYDISCATHSRCIELYPAVCRCDTGYVFSTTENFCTNQRIIMINGLHVNMKWVYTYANVSSHDFLRLASSTEIKLKSLFQKLQISSIDGVKVIRAHKKGGVLLDVSLTATVKSIFETLVQIFTNKNSTVLSAFRQMSINTDTIPIIERGSTFESELQGVDRTKTVSLVLKDKSIVAPASRKVNITTDPNYDSTVMPINVIDPTVESTTQGMNVISPKTLPLVKSSVIPTPWKVNIITINSDDNSTVMPALLETVMRNNSIVDDNVGAYSRKDILLLCIVLSLSCVVILGITALVCHYKRNIYYHVLTW